MSPCTTSCFTLFPPGRSSGAHRPGFRPTTYRKKEIIPPSWSALICGPHRPFHAWLDIATAQLAKTGWSKNSRFTGTNCAKSFHFSFLSPSWSKDKLFCKFSVGILHKGIYFEKDGIIIARDKVISSRYMNRLMLWNHVSFEKVALEKGVFRV